MTSLFQYQGLADPLQPIVKDGWLQDIEVPVARRASVAWMIAESNGQVVLVPVVAVGGGSYLMLLGVQ